MSQNSLFWFRRDLRLHDNRGLEAALNSGRPVIPLFIIDTGITDELERDDARITFIFNILREISGKLTNAGSSLRILKGNPADLFDYIIDKWSVAEIFVNEDYEPYSLERDSVVKGVAAQKGVSFSSFRDHVIFSPGDILKKDGKPYTVYTPYSKVWLAEYQRSAIEGRNNTGDVTSVGMTPTADYLSRFAKGGEPCRCDSESHGFKTSQLIVEPYDLGDKLLLEYEQKRDLPWVRGTSMIGPHLRFGTVSIREVAARAAGMSLVFLKELAWREFFIQILFHFPHVVTDSFRPHFDRIEWLNDGLLFERWCNGTTGYPIVDAGMRQLNQTGFMHNRVRMITASFLSKHLLTDWRWGEAWFASHLLDYELSSNNGNWQWAAGTGCDASPWFRVFNPTLQQKKFDAHLRYVTEWVPEYGTTRYPDQVVDHSMARERAILAYKAIMHKT
ncbi:MAG: deoxyribodipyrimidine photo-lyase [Bacteroidales bacterium]